jgi:hypothetical protein
MSSTCLEGIHKKERKVVAVVSTAPLSRSSTELVNMQTAFFGNTKAFKAQGVKAGSVRPIHLCHCVHSEYAERQRQCCTVRRAACAPTYIAPSCAVLR